MSDLENDPAADFLAREQEDLANIDDDLGFANITHNEETHNEENGVDDAPVNGGWENTLEVTDPEVLAINTSGERIEDRRSPFVPFIPEPESERVVAWREEFQKRVEEMDQAELEKKAEMENEAKKALDDWLRHLNEQQDKRKTSNREHEQALMKERAEDNPGEQWERVCRLCDFNPKSGKTVCLKDTSRMRGILLQLKQEPLVR